MQNSSVFRILPRFRALSPSHKSLALLLSAATITPVPAFADVLIDHVEGISPDGNGGVERFEGFLISDDGHIREIYRKGDKRPKSVDYKVDGKGRFVTPGMIDAHGHVMGTGFAKMTLDLSSATSLDNALSRISAWSAAHPELPWILGHSWNQAQWGTDTMPTAADLDRVTGGKPTWLTRADGHSGWANTAALNAANITETTADPTGGAILRLAGTKIPSGVLVDTAKSLMDGKLPFTRPEDRDTAFAEAQLDFLAAGVTTIADMGTTIEDWQTYRRAADRGALRIRIVSYAAGIDAMTLIGGPSPTPWLYDDRLRMNGVKLVLDGALGSRGAWLKEPYADASSTKGLPQIAQTRLGNLMSRAAMDNFQVAIHAIGDAANATALNSIAELSETYKGDRRWRIEHAQIIDPADLPRFANHGVIASMQPQHQSSDFAMAETRLGPNRLAGAYAWKSILNAGGKLAFGSDTPVEPARPFLGLASAISRQNAKGEPVGGWQPQEVLSKEAALSAYTTGAAWSLFAEGRLGRIAKGYRADFLFVDTDVMAATPQQLRDTRVLETWIGGKLAWSAAQDSRKAGGSR